MVLLKCCAITKERREIHVFSNINQSLLSVLGQAGIRGAAGKDIPATPQGTFLLSGSHGGVLERQVACMEQREDVYKRQGTSWYVPGAEVT